MQLILLLAMLTQIPQVVYRDGGTSGPVLRIYLPTSSVSAFDVDPASYLIAGMKEMSGLRISLTITSKDVKLPDAFAFTRACHDNQTVCSLLRIEKDGELIAEIDSTGGWHQYGSREETAQVLLMTFPPRPRYPAALLNAIGGVL